MEQPEAGPRRDAVGVAATLPNALLIGAAKSGTSSLFRYLVQHPDVFPCAVKEPKILAFEGRPLTYDGPGDVETNHVVVHELEAYRSLFRGGEGAAIRIEASTLYLHDPAAPDGIRRHVPDAKLIAILRDPVQRAFSAWLHLRREGREPEVTFAGGLAAEPKRGGWDLLWQYEAAGRYDEQLARYEARFPKEQLLVLLHEDLSADPVGVTRSVFRFLGVDDAFRPDTERRHNATRVPRSRNLDRWLTRPNLARRLGRVIVPLGLRRRIVESLHRRNAVRPTLPPEVEAELRRRFAPGVLRLQERLGRDLSAWLPQAD